MPIFKIKEYIQLYIQREEKTVFTLQQLKQHQEYIQETIQTYLSISKKSKHIKKQTKVSE
ncbi:hypothetical protein ACWOC1_11420 [Enterococcus quebecensis]|nr:hypothetical protein [Enterococcus quebecensis]OJG74994.1 hypothetical protein RV12_GL002039 [Enterococcus quebecensis]